MTQLRLSVLNRFQATLAETPFAGFRSAKTQALLAYLAVESARPHSRAVLAGLLWPDQPEPAAQHNLSQSLLNLRQLLGDATAHPSFFLATRQTIQFNPASDHWLDCAELAAHLAAVQAHAHADGKICAICARALAQAVDLYHGPFLAEFSLAGSDLFEEWALLKREWLHRQVVEALEQLIEFHERENDYQLAERYAQRLVALDPLREAAHRHLMRALALSGQRNAALAQYDASRRILAAELDVEPAAETTALYEHIRTNELRIENEELRIPANSVSQFSILNSQFPHEAPNLGSFYGRAAELATLRGWLVDEHCQLVAVLGMGGVGKTALAAKLAEENAGQFDRVIWRSLLNAPPLDELLRGYLQTLTDQRLANLPHGLDERLDLLLDQLRAQRCLLILDNLESIFQADERAGRYRPGYADYGQLIQSIGQRRHRSCLLLTSRERPLELARLEGKTPHVRSLQLAGLTMQGGQAILQDHGLSGSTTNHDILIEHYSGNPLALKLVGATVRDLFAGDVAAFLRDETPIFDDIRDVLDQQFARLSHLERELLLWLAIEREPTTIPALLANLVHRESQRAVLEVLRSLQRRSLLEQPGEGFTLQNVVMEYTTDVLVTQVLREIETDRLDLFARHALAKAQAREYVRQSQLRLTLAPLAERLAARLGRANLLAKLRALPDALRARPDLASSYAAGNLLNLLIHMGADLRGLDFAWLAVWQASLRGARAPELNLAHADLTGSTFSDTFGSAFVVAFSPDGQTLAAGTNLGDVRLWQVATGQPIGRLSGHGHAIWGLAFSPDGRILASGSLDQTIRLWDVQTAQIRQVLRGHTEAVFAVAFSPDGATLASTSTDRTVRLWDVQRGEQRRILEGHTDIVRAVAFSPDGTTVASGGYDGTIRLWHAESGEVEAVLAGHAQPVYAIAFSPNGALLASASGDRTVHVWNLSARQPWHMLQHPQLVKTVAFSPNGVLLASGAYDNAIRLWDVDSCQCLHILSGSQQRVDSVAFSPDGEMLASASNDQAVRLWHVRSGQPLTTLYGYNNPIYAVAVSPDGAAIASGGGDEAVRLWDVETSRARWLLEGHSGQIQAVAFSPTGAQVASAASDRTVRLWDAGSGQLLDTLHGHTDSVYAVAFSPAGTLLASASEDQTIRVWDVRSGETLQVLHDPTAVRSVVFHPDGTTLLGASEDGTIRRWDITSGNCVGMLVGHASHVSSIALSPDGTTVVSGGNDRSVRVWDLVSGACRHVLTGHTNWINAVAFSPDGATIASASVGGMIWLWHSGTGQHLHTLHGHSANVETVAFSPDGTEVVSGAFDGTIKLWDAQIGSCLRTLRADGPYAGMNIAGATGLIEAQRSALKALGAVER